MRQISFSEAISTVWPDPDFVFGALQPGDLGLVSGADGAGKSFLSDVVALTVATGKTVNNVFAAPKFSGPVLMLKGEDRLEDHGRRFQALASRAGVKDVDIDILALEGGRKPILKLGRDGVEETEYFEWLLEIGRGYRMVIIDPIIMFHDVGEGPEIDHFARALIRIAHSNQQAILGVHHASQDAILNSRDDHHAGRGGTHLPAACRQVWVLRGMSEKEAKDFKINEEDRKNWKSLSNGKASNGKENGRIWLMRDENGILYRPPYLPSDLIQAKPNHLKIVKKGEYDDDFEEI